MKTCRKRSIALPHLPRYVPAARFLLPLTLFLDRYQLARRDELPGHHMNFLLFAGIRVCLIREYEILVVGEC